MNESHIFLNALGRTNPADRDAYLDEACAGDSRLRFDVEALLRAHDTDPEFLEQPAVGRDTTQDFPPSPGSTVATGAAVGRPGLVLAGRYELVESIGVGGMGEVWVARQTEPVRRKVAVKLIKAGMDSKQVLTRFEAERQALALMDHPHIAKVLDGGLTAEGRPFFVMELVDGVPINRFCDTHRLTLRRRLELMVLVCQAVQHAHQKGVIHRDLKPSNILVAESDGRPTPKIIDFGVAKATGPELTEQSLHTGLGTVVGTPEYMSPEQASFNNPDVDTRSDVYSLGVLLYELLAGSPPFIRKHAGGPGLLEILRVVREDEPTRPSARLSGADELPTLAAYRATDAVRLPRLVRGELDWIVLKALEKDRARRYETASDLARNIQLYLTDQPVEARPPSRWYRARKFLRRNRGPVLAATVVLAALFGGIVGTTLGLLEGRRQRDFAGEQLNEANEARRREGERADGELKAKIAAAASAKQAESEKHQAQESEADTAALADFLANYVLAATRPDGVQGGFGINVTMAEALEKAELKVAEVFRGRPRAEALARQDIGVTWRNLGRYVDAERNLRRALELRRAFSTPDHLNLLDTLNSLGVTLSELGRETEAIAMLEEAVRGRTARLGRDDSHTLNSMINLATVLSGAGYSTRATPMFEEVVNLANTRFDPGHQTRLTAMIKLAKCLMDSEQADRALPLAEQALQVARREHGPDHVLTLDALAAVACCCREAGRLDRAVALFEELVQRTKTKYPPEHPVRLDRLTGLAQAHSDAGFPERAIPLLELIYPLAKTNLGDDHRRTQFVLRELADAYRKANQPDRALSLLEDDFWRGHARPGNCSLQMLKRTADLAVLYLTVQRSDEAACLAYDAFLQCQDRLGSEHHVTLSCMATLAEAYKSQGRFELAVPLYEKTLELTIARFGPDDPTTLMRLVNLAECYRAARQVNRAIPLLEQALRLRKTRLGPTHPYTIGTTINLAGAHQEAGRLDDALPLLQDVLRLSRGRYGPDHENTISAMNFLAVLYWKLKKFDQSIPLLEEVVRHRRAKNGEDDLRTLRSIASLGVNYHDAGRPADAVPLLEEAYRRGRHHATLKWVGEGLLAAYVAMGNAKGATQMVTEQIEAARRQLPPDSLRLADALGFGGRTLVKAKAFVDAEKLMLQCLAIGQKKAPDAWPTFDYQSLLGAAVLGQRRFEDAEPLLLGGYEGLKTRTNKLSQKGRVRLPEAADRLIELYTAWGKPTEAMKWRIERAQYPEFGPKPREVR